LWLELRLFYFFRGESEMNRSLPGTLILVSLFLVGCGGGDGGKPKLVPVQGTVIFKGAPVEGATVTFYAETAPRPATGTTDAEGKFRLTTYDTNDGAIPGDHTISISKVSSSASSGPLTQENMKEKMARDMAAMKGGKAAEMKPETQLPARYADPKTSKESRKVVEGDANDFKIELTE
jgi:hypothetical protein